MTPESVRQAADVMMETLAPLANKDWNAPAGTLEWSCRQTMEHVAHALDRYTLHLAASAQERLNFQPVSHPECSPMDLLLLIQYRAAVLCGVATAASPEARSIHVFGRPDAEGFVAMGSVETLVHTDDVARGLGGTVRPPADLIRDILTRLFPWAPRDTDPWLTMQWATGRGDLPGHTRVGDDWAWFASPLSEWDGAVKTRASYQ